MSFTTPFAASSPTIGGSYTGAASASAALPNKGNNLRIVNEGPDNAFISVAAGVAPAAVAADGTARANATPILAGSDISLTIPSDAVQNFSIISRGTSVINLSVGEGI